MWLHYSRNPLQHSELVSKNQTDQTDEYNPYHKPKGLWITDDSEYNWERWVREEDFCTEKFVCKSQIDLDLTDIHWIKNLRQFDAFNKKFSMETKALGLPRLVDKTINWQLVASHYKGVIITPYQGQRRLNRNCNWYYGWDVASGCIWNISAVRSCAYLGKADYGPRRDALGSLLTQYKEQAECT